MILLLSEQIGQAAGRKGFEERVSIFSSLSPTALTEVGADLNWQEGGF